MHLYILPFLALDLIAGAFDAYETLIGLEKNSGLEGNSLVTAMIKVLGRTPALIAYNLVKTAAFGALSLIPSPVFIGGSIAALVASAAGHIQGGLKWRYLIKGGQIDRAKTYTWWQKLLGMGWD